jgi:UDP-GlcNAc:undecaprenyl-phosphate/decaprenyl-phosphate GlcNAc-1-phosphate transferase
MHTLIALAVSAFAICFILTPVLRDLFVRADLLDRPDCGRKLHTRAVPRMGGIPIVLSYAAAMGLLFAFHPFRGRLYIQHQQLIHAVLPSACVIFFVGLLDDLIGLRPWHKLAGQTLAAVLAVFLGVRLSFVHLPHFVSIVFSVCWVIACTNAVNLIDGMDGLATGVGLFATITTMSFALANHNFGLALMTAPLAGCLLAFLRYNFSPATIFLGDCGSLTIGFVLGCFSLIWSDHAGNMLGMAAPAMALALPLIDVTIAIGRRFLRNVPIFSADRGHIHHMMLARGFSPKTASLVLYGVCGMAALLAMLESFGRNGLKWPVIAAFSLLVFFGIKRLNYIEFREARKTLSKKSVSRAIQDAIYLEELDRALIAADTIDACWQIIRESCRRLQFASVEMKLRGYCYFEVLVDTAEEPYCRIELALGAQDFLLLTRLAETNPPPCTMTVLNHIRSNITLRLPELETVPILVANTTAA